MPVFLSRLPLITIIHVYFAVLGGIDPSIHTQRDQLMNIHVCNLNVVQALALRLGTASLTSRLSLELYVSSSIPAFPLSVSLTLSLFPSLPLLLFFSLPLLPFRPNQDRCSLCCEWSSSYCHMTGNS